MTLLFVIVAVYLVVGVLNVMFRNRSDHDYENYHEDPYSYFPRNPGPPAYFTPPPVYPNFYQGSQMYPPYPPPMYLPPAQTPPASNGGSFFFGLGFFMILLVALMGLAVKMKILSVEITFGEPSPSERKYERDTQPAPGAGSDDVLVLNH